MKLDNPVAGEKVLRLCVEKVRICAGRSYCREDMVLSPSIHSHSLKGALILYRFNRFKGLLDLTYCAAKDEAWVSNLLRKLDVYPLLQKGFEIIQKLSGNCQFCGGWGASFVQYDILNGSGCNHKLKTEGSRPLCKKTLRGKLQQHIVSVLPDQKQQGQERHSGSDPSAQSANPSAKAGISAPAEEFMVQSRADVGEHHRNDHRRQGDPPPMPRPKSNHPHPHENQYARFAA